MLLYIRLLERYDRPESRYSMKDHNQYRWMSSYIAITNEEGFEGKVLEEVQEVLYRTRKPRPDSRRASVGTISLDRGHASRVMVCGYERELLLS